MTREELIRLLNAIQRHTVEAKQWHEEIVPDEWGEWIRADDLAAAFGLVLDGVFDPLRDTSRGFAEIQK